jgi:hypothetical protein
MALEQEISVFERELPSLLKQLHEGKFALVSKSEVISVCNSMDEALEAGYDHFGSEPFLVKQIVEHEEPLYCSRHLRCH